MNDIGRRLIEIRKKLGMTQKEFADNLGISLGAMQGYEYGKAPKGEILKSLLDMGYDINWLLAGQGQMLREQSHDVALDRMLMWNVAYFLCKRSENGEDPEAYADTFIEIYDTMLAQSQKDEEEKTKESNIVDFTMRRLGSDK